MLSSNVHVIFFMSWLVLFEKWVENSPASGSNLSTSEDQCDEEINKIGELDFRDMINRLTRGENPWDNHQELINMGTALRNQGKHEEALQCYDKAIRRQTSQGSPYKFRAIVHLQMRNLLLAISDLRTALLFDSNNKEVRILLCRALFDAGNYHEAVQETLQLDDKDLVQLGRKLFSKGEFELTLRCYSEAIVSDLRKKPTNLSIQNLYSRKKPSEARYYRLRGNCHMNMHQLDRAIFDFEAAVRMNPNSEINRIYLNQALLKSGRYTQVIEETTALNETALVNLGDDFRVNRKFEEAISSYSEAIKKNPRKAEYYQKRGQCYRVMGGELANAISDFRTVIKLEPSNINWHFDMVELLLETGRIDEAVDVLGDVDFKSVMESELRARFDKVCEEIKEKGGDAMCARLEQMSINKEEDVGGTRRRLFNKMKDILTHCTIM